MVIKLDELVEERLKEEAKIMDDIMDNIDSNLTTIEGEKLLDGKFITADFRQTVSRRIADKLVEMYQKENLGYVIISERDGGGGSDNYSHLKISKKG